MITCMGIVVGVIESANRQNVLNQCAKFLRTHKYLGSYVEFEIDNKFYARAIDTCDDDNIFSVLFKTHDGITTIGVA